MARQSFRQLCAVLRPLVADGIGFQHKVIGITESSVKSLHTLTPSPVSLSRPLYLALHNVNGQLHLNTGCSRFESTVAATSSGVSASAGGGESETAATEAAVASDVSGAGSSPVSSQSTASTVDIVESDIPTQPAGETYAYQAEVSRLLDLIVHSLYSHKEVFLRELVSNANDALDKLRFLSVTEPHLLGSNTELAIKIRANAEKGVLVITDSGIGMTKDELVKSLGTIAQSGTANFVKALKENKDAGANNLIGRFGVGFYSAFLVSDKVAVSTRSPKSDKQYVWEAVADNSSFVVREETDPDYIIPRGTSVILYLKNDMKSDFLNMSKITDLVRNYSQFLSFPIYVGQERTRQVEVRDEAGAEEVKEGEAKVKDETGAEEVKEGEPAPKTVTEKYYHYDIVNENKPIWLRSPREVMKEEYHAFYKKTYNEHLEPMAYTHFSTEGEVEFKSLIYVPGMAPFGAEEAGRMKNIKLYVKRVFISDDFNGELFPPYLSFMKGVVDSNDLPLNVSRELLQESRIVRLMKKRLTKKCLDLFEAIANSKDPEDYRKFYRNFGKYLKFGCSQEDNPNQKRLANLLRFYSSKHQDEMTSLKQYVADMKPGQKGIYYFSSESVKSARNAPFLEQLYNKDLEVLFMTETLDEVTATHLKYYEGKKFIDVSKETFNLDDDEKQKQLANEYSLLCNWMKKKLGERIAKVQVSKRLSTSPCVLVSGKDGWSANMERVMRAQNLGDTPGLREFMWSTRVLEINPSHPVIQDLDEARKSGRPGSKEQVELLLETALMSSGFVPEDPAGFGSKIYELVGAQLARERSNQQA
ncbi:hypothetical protein KP509_27G012500 [Ceratopteris richardii]|uniref:Heat shock protein 90 n=1 Tax=Ceratopteris richardii TaxID=49495 RepID=A0A8T2RFE2_CERRI|nr:hypothetical protein KP509_27G012500 [Ceratopteris richardii]